MSQSRILIVDDHHETRQVLKAALSTLSPRMEVVDVPSGEEAMLMILMQSFDLLVIDIRLAGISGLELMAQVKKKAHKPRMVLITGSTDSELRGKIISAGADAFFYKPIEIPEFLKTVQELLGEENEQFFAPDLLEQKSTGENAARPFAEPRFSSQDLSSLESTAWVDSQIELIIQEWIEKSGLNTLACFDGQSHVCAQAGDWSSEEIFRVVVEFIPHLGKIGIEGMPPGLGDDFEYGGWCVGKRLILWSGITADIILVGLADANYLEIHPKGVSVFQSIARRVAEFIRDAELGKNLDVASLHENELSNQELNTDLGDLESLLATSKENNFPDVDAFWESVSSQVEYQDLDQKGIPYDQARQLGLTSGEEINE